MKIVRLKTANAHVLQDINALLRQLSAGHEKGVTLRTLKNILRDPHHELWAAKDGTRIVGMGTLIVFLMLSGDAAEVEDVVVDESYRGRGMGTLIVKKLVERARVRRCDDVNLTSRPSRRAANALYQKLGFRKRDTNVYRLAL